MIAKYLLVFSSKSSVALFSLHFRRSVDIAQTLLPKLTVHFGSPDIVLSHCCSVFKITWCSDADLSSHSLLSALPIFYLRRMGHAISLSLRWILATFGWGLIWIRKSLRYGSALLRNKHYSVISRMVLFLLQTHHTDTTEVSMFR